VAAAIRLLAAGHAVVLEGPEPRPDPRLDLGLDAESRGAGRASGFVFDEGPALITAPWLIQELFDLSGRATADYVRLVPLDPFYDVRFDDGTVFRYSAHHDDIVRQIRQRSLKDVRGYLRYRDAAARVFDTAGNREPSAERLVQACIRDPRLRQVFTATLRLTGATPFHPASTHTLEQRWGVWFPLGGTRALKAALLRLVDELGGAAHVTPAPVNASVGAQPQSSGRLAAQLSVMSFGTDCQYVDMAHHTILLGANAWMYVHRPSATDRSLAPSGCDSLSIMTPIQDRDSIVHFLEAHGLPSLSRHIVAEGRLKGVGAGDSPGTGLPGALDAGRRHAIQMSGS
jgi:phytoene desaturase